MKGVYDCVSLECSNLKTFWCTLTHPSYNSLTIRAQVVVFTYPMVHHCDMEERMAQEVMDVCVNACEKHWINWSNSQMVCLHMNRNQIQIVLNKIKRSFQLSLKISLLNASIGSTGTTAKWFVFT